MMKPDLDLDDSNILERLDQTTARIRAELVRLNQKRKAKRFRGGEGLDDVVISMSQHSLLNETPQASQEDSEEFMEPEPTTYSKRPLTDPGLSERTKRDRVRACREYLHNIAEEQECTIYQLIGYILHLEAWPQKRDVSKIGMDFFDGKLGGDCEEAKEFSLMEGLWFRERLGLNKVQYSELRIRLLDYRVDLPPYYALSEHASKMVPTPIIYKHGIRTDLEESLRMTLKERLMTLDKDIGTEITFSYDYGMDGSGRQAEYARALKEGFSTEQLMTCCFGIRQIKVNDNEIWSASVAGGANSPLQVRPLALFPAKESDEVLRDYMAILEPEVDNLKENGLVIELPDGRIIEAKIDEAAMKYLDGKMIATLLQLRGGFCTVCTATIDEAHNLINIEAGFDINSIERRSVESIREIAEKLYDEDTGTIRTSSGDYKTRQGVTGVPMTKLDLTKQLPVCHAKIKCFEWIIELILRLNSHKKWLERRRLSDDERTAYRREEELLQSAIKERLGIKIKDPNNMTRGNAFAERRAV